MGDKNGWQIRLKLWLEIDGCPVIGEGRHAMLDAIDEQGSIIEAARSLGISYRKIRGAISDMEGTLKTSLVRTYRGGDQGGGAKLTPAARDLAERYLKVAHDFTEKAEFQRQDIENKNVIPNGRNCHSVVMNGRR